ncbi:MAG: dihydroorotase [Bacteroidales bacterium]|nr:dihydroorotase [Bacteroidales bacterium]
MERSSNKAEERYDLLFDNVRLALDRDIRLGHLGVTGEMITLIGEGKAPAEVRTRATTIVEGGERLLMPGVIDEHVHFRDPGLTHKADMSTESIAAVAGGVTSFIDMPNTNPATTTMAAVEAKLQRASEVSLANYGFFIGATNTNLPELLAADYSRVAGVKLFLGSSTGNMLVDRQETIRRIFSEVPALIAVHAEDEAIIKRNRQAVIDRYGDDLPIDFHPVIRSHEACYEATKTAVELAHETGARLHVMHISTAHELQFFHPGPVAEKRITAETCPQYLIFSDELYPSLGARIKCNPAIKHAEDRETLISALDKGIIDTVATDHAPHLLQEKEGSVFKAVSGMPMIQFSLPVMLDLVNSRRMELTTVVETMCHNPATILRIDRRGWLREGYYADLTLVDDHCDPYVVDASMIKSRCGWSPLEGVELHSRVDMTVVGGRMAYRYGVVFGSVRGKSLRFLQNS